MLRKGMGYEKPKTRKEQIAQNAWNRHIYKLSVVRHKRNMNAKKVRRAQRRAA